MAHRLDRIDKLRRLAGSPNPHEAALAREEAARLEALEPASARRAGPDPAFPHQLPDAIRVPWQIGGR